MVTALRRSFGTALLLAAFGTALAASVAGAADPAPTEEDILQQKCTLCHSGHRIYRINPDQIRPVLERMRKMNPDWITAIEVDHIAVSLTKILGDPSALSARTAWFEAVDRGEKLFKDTSLGTSGKSCSSCHTPGSLRNVEDAYPKFSAALKRFVDMQEAINLMIKEKMQGTPLPPNDQKYFDLLAYIKSLK